MARRRLMTVPMLLTWVSALGCGAQAIDEQAVEEVADELTTSTYQAENAFLYGAVKSSANSGYSGSGYVDFQHSSGDYIDWTVNIPTTGDYNLIFRYANGGSTNRPLKLTMDGSTVNSTMAFNPTGSWSTWKTATQKTKLSSGTRHIRLTAIGYNGGNIDYLQSSGPLTSTLCAAYKGGAMITFDIAGESLRVWITDGTFINEALRLLARGETRVPVFASLLDGRDCDGHWTWHPDASKVAFADIATEVCDGRPSDIEKDKAYWLYTVKRYCPFGAKVKTVDDRR